MSGDWELLMTASQRCGFGIVEHSEGVVVSVDYRSCLQKKVRRKFADYTNVASYKYFSVPGWNVQLGTVWRWKEYSFLSNNVGRSS